MIKKIIATCGVFGILLTVAPALAAQPNLVPAHTAKTPHPISVVIPEHAVEIADGVFNIGQAVDADGRTVQGIAFVHYKEGFGHKDGHSKGKGGGGGGNEASCYAFIANGARWRGEAAESYIFDSTNIRGLNKSTLHTLLATSLNSWDDQVAFDIFGFENATSTVDRNAIGTLNNQNEILFADIESSGAIAATYVWGIFSGKPSLREIVEWDMVFDDVSFDWSAETNGIAGKMDFHNIAAHETGHAAGMGHPSLDCAEETMHRYADFGEIKKRTLETGDIAGINALY